MKASLEPTPPPHNVSATLKALLRSEERYRLIIDSVKDYAIFMLDAEGRVQTWNPGAEAAKGYSAGEIIGNHIAVFYTPEDRQAGRPGRLLELAARQGRVEDEGWRVRKDGSRFWADVVITAIRDEEGGEVIGFSKVTRDLTERRRSEENERRLWEERAAREASEASLRATRFLAQASKALSSTLDLETAVALVARLVVPALGDNCVVDLVQPDGTVRRVAEAAAEPRSEALLRELRRFPPGRGRNSPVLDVLRDGSPVFIPRFDADVLDALGGDDEYKRLVTQLAPRSSVTVAVRNRDRILGAITCGMAGSGRSYGEADIELAEELGRRAGAAVDNAILFEAERAARREASMLYRLSDAVSRAETAEGVFDAAFDAIRDAVATERASILLLDTQGVMRFRASRGISEAYRNAVDGVSPWPAGAHDAREIVVQDVRADAALAAYASALDAEGIRSLAHFPLVASGRLIGRLTTYYGEPHAFTEAERRAAAAIASHIAFAVEKRGAQEERERFLGIVGHDLRNPLSAIAMSANALLRRDLDEAASRTVRRIVSSAERMERLISQLLTFAQARQGSGVPLRPAEVDLGEIARHVVGEIEAAHPEHVIRVDESGDLGGVWDADRLAEVLSNLLGNAIQHGDGSPVVVRLAADVDSVTVEVQNHGAAIPPDLLPRLFDPFRQGRSGERRKGGSVGLGLYISRELVRAHGGTIAASSDEARGTMFSIRLPRRAAAGP